MCGFCLSCLGEARAALQLCCAELSGFSLEAQGTKEEGRLEGDGVSGKAGSAQEDRCQGGETLHKR